MQLATLVTHSILLFTPSLSPSSFLSCPLPSLPFSSYPSSLPSLPLPLRFLDLLEAEVHSPSSPIWREDFKPHTATGDRTLGASPAGGMSTSGTRVTTELASGAHVCDTGCHMLSLLVTCCIIHLSTSCLSAVVTSCRLLSFTCHLLSPRCMSLAVTFCHFLVTPCHCPVTPCHPYRFRLS